MASLLDRTVVGVLPFIPRPIVGYFSRPYIAGSTTREALEVVRALHGSGARTTLDILGEHIERAEEAERAHAGYMELLDAIHGEGIDTGVSVKLTQLGLKLDFDECYRRMESLVVKAEEYGIFVRIDMEDSTCTDATLEIHRRLKENHRRVGTVIQSMLRRSAADVTRLAAERADIRICKGIYVEPHRIAFRDREIIRRSFVELLEILIRGGCRVAIATHDERLVYESLRLIRAHGVGKEQYEFQMLLGVSRSLRKILLESGHPLRVYVPFGRQWYAYSVRRLKENPQLAGTIARAAFSGGNRKG
jgi:proline dehydrogenase